MTAPSLGRVEAPWWDERPVFIVGGGPSLKGHDLSRLRERGTVLGINRAIELVPCDAFFTLDFTFLKERHDLIVDFAADGGDTYAALPEGRDDIGAVPGVRYIRRVQGEGLSADPSAIVNGLNSGYGALNLAVLKHAQEIYLLGFDLHKTNRADNHWHDGYDWSNGSSMIYYQRWADRFYAAAADLPEGVAVYNANPDSAVKAFPIKSYEELGL